MKLARTKGSNLASESGICCLSRGPEETPQGQRQQTRLRSRNLLPSPLIQSDSSVFSLRQQFRRPKLYCEKAQDIHLREKNIAYPTERSKMLMHFLARGKDMRFSMKMVLAPAQTIEVAVRTTAPRSDVLIALDFCLHSR